MGKDQSRQALAWMWEGRQGKKPHSRVSPRGREDRGEAGPRGGCGPAWPPSPRPLRVASVFRNVLSLAGAAKEMDRAQGRGPRQVAGGSDTFLAQAHVPCGHCSKAVGRSCIWGCGSAARPPAIC